MWTNILVVLVRVPNISKRERGILKCYWNKTYRQSGMLHSPFGSTLKLSNSWERGDKSASPGTGKDVIICSSTNTNEHILISLMCIMDKKVGDKKITGKCFTWRMLDGDSLSEGLSFNDDGGETSRPRHL
jgi:hypothetical protein